MDVLFISPTYSGAGGIGPHSFRVAEKLREQGFDVELMHVPHIPIKNLKNLSFSFFGTLKAINNSKSYDAVHAWNVPSAFIMKKIKAKKKILSVHGVYSKQVGMLHSKITSNIINSKESQVLDWADKLTTDSKSTQKLYKEKSNIDFEYLPSPLDTDMFENIGTVEKIENQVAYVGRDSYEKGIDILKDAEDEINGNVVYCTNRSWEDAMKIIKSSSVVVVPSRMESLPTTVKEAFFLNVPVIGSDVGGIPELIKNNETGVIIPPENPSKLAQAVNELLSDNEKSEKLAANGNQFVKNNLTWDVVLPKYIQFYENLLKN